MIASATATGYACSCPVGFNVAAVNGSCIPSAAYAAINLDFPSSNIGLLQFTRLVSPTGASSQSIRSEVISSMFVRVAAKCRYEYDEQSCQTLANMCVLQDYDDTLSSSTCKIYIAIARERGSLNDEYPDWPKQLPWLYYNELRTGDAATTMETDVNLNFATYPSLSGNKLKFVLARYTFAGVFKGFELLEDQLQFCPLNSVTKRSFANVGVTLTNKCSFNLKHLIGSNSATDFFDLYLIDSTGKLIPVPVKVINLRKNGANINGNIGSTSLSGVRLTRRFFLLDTLSTQPSGGGRPTIVRIADSILLRIPLEQLSGTNAKV
eukprot:Partr_v1_DN27926_c1_g1_i4_m11572 putative Transmembrane protein 67